MLQKYLFSLAICLFLWAMTACGGNPTGASSGKTTPAPRPASSLSSASDSSRETQVIVPFSAGEWFLEDLGAELYEISFWKNIASPTDRSFGFISYYLDKNPDAPYVEREGARYYDQALVEAFLLERFELEPQDIVTCSTDFDPFRAPDPEAPEPSYVPTLPPVVTSVEQMDGLITVQYEIYSQEQLISHNKLIVRILPNDSFRYVSNEVNWKIPRNA